MTTLRQHSAVGALLLCACASADGQTGNALNALALELLATNERLATVEQILWATRGEVARLNSELDDARILTLLGGPPRRWHGGGVTCDGDLYLPGSLGEAAHRALMETGHCDPDLGTQLVKR